MSKEGHTEEQIIAVLRLVQAGERVADICCKLGTRSSNLLPVEGASTPPWRRASA